VGARARARPRVPLQGADRRLRVQSCRSAPRRLRGGGDRHRADSLDPDPSLRDRVWPATALIYWARNPGWLVYDADFRSLARRYPGFSYLPVLREPPPTWRGEKGEPAEAVDRLVFGVDKLIVYVCGGGETVNRVRDTLVKKGMDRKSVKWEKFW